MGFWKQSEGELAPVLLTLGQSFLVGLPRVFTATAAGVIFLEHFSATTLPYAYLVSGLVLSALGVLYVRAERRFTLFAGVGTFVLLAAALLVGRGLLEHEAMVPKVAFGLILFSEAEFTLGNVTFWSLANRVFGAREAGRDFGLVSAGEVVPTVVGGLLVPLLVHRIGVADLLYLSAGAHLLSGAYLVFVRRALRDRLASPAEPKAQGPKKKPRLRELLANRYLVLVAALLWFNVVTFYFVDNAFYGAVQAQLPDPSTLASFLGGFFVVLGLLNLVFKVGLSPRWREWFGMRASILTTPASLAVCCGLVLVAPTFGEDATKLFALVVILKLVERVFIEGVHNPTYYALFQPIPVGVRTAAQNAIETVIAQGATLLAACGLLAVNHFAGGMSVTSLVAVTLSVAMLWLVFGFAAGKQYSRQLRDALGQPLVESGDLDAGDVAAHLAQGLRSPHVRQVLYTLELVRAHPAAKVDSELRALLDHPSAMVIEQAGRLLAQRDMRLAQGALIDRLHRPVAAELRTAWLRALSAVDSPEAVAALRTALTALSPNVRGAAAAGLLAGRPEARKAALPVIDSMTRSTEAPHREAAALALAEAKEPLEQPLAMLLGDSTVAVRRAAIHAVARSRAKSLFPRLTAALEDPEVRAVAAHELGELGLEAAPELVRALPRSLGAARRELLALAARLSSPEIEAAFERILSGADRDEALLVAELLAENGRPAPHRLVAPLQRRLVMELDHHTRLVELVHYFDAAPAADLLVDALEGALDRCTLAILFLLALLHDPQLRSMWRRLQLGHLESLGLSLEYLESVLPPELVSKVRPVFDPEARDVLSDPGLRVGARQRLQELIRSPAPWLTPWIRAAAAEALRASGQSTEPIAKVVERVQALRRAPPFRLAPSESLAALADRSQERALAPGELLLARGATNASLFLVLEGALVCEGSHGVEAGECVELYSALRPRGCPAPINAVYESRVLEVRGDVLQALVQDDFTFAWKVLLALCEVLRPGGASASQPRQAEPSGAAPPAPSSPLERVLALSGVELFRGLDERVLTALAAAADERCFAAGEALMREGELGTSMFVLAEGRVMVEREGNALARLEAPEVIGELAALMPAPRAATVTAELPVRALILERDVFFELLRSHPEIVLRILELLVRRVPTGETKPVVATIDPTVQGVRTLAS